MTTSVIRKSVGLVLILGIAILFSTLAQAQPQRMSVEDRVKMLKDSLKLSSEQCVKIKEILEDQREEMTTTMNENRGDREAMRSVMQELMKKTNGQIKAVLTGDQVKKFDTMLQGRRARIGRRTQ